MESDKPAELTDIQKENDNRELRIDKVGVRNLRFPIRIRDIPHIQFRGDPVCVCSGAFLPNYLFNKFILKQPGASILKKINLTGLIKIESF